MVELFSVSQHQVGFLKSIHCIVLVKTFTFVSFVKFLAVGRFSFCNGRIWVSVLGLLINMKRSKIGRSRINNV